MATHTIKLSVLVLATLTGTSVAKNRDKDELSRDALGYLARVYQMETGKSGAQMETVDDCKTMIADAKKLGLASDDHLAGLWYLNEKPAPLKQEDDGDRYVTVGDLPKICERYGKLQPGLAVVNDLDGFSQNLEWKEHLALEEVGPDYPRGVVDLGTKCMAAVEAAIAATTADLAFVLDGDATTLGQARAAICQGLLDWGNDWVGKLDALNAQRQEDAEAPYKAVGMKGARLELFSTYGDTVVWNLPGCTKTVSDPKQLKKAKKLFVWWTASDGKITISKFVFKGDKYTQTDKVTYNPDKAYKYCR